MTTQTDDLEAIDVVEEKLEALDDPHEHVEAPSPLMIAHLEAPEDDH